MHYLVGDIQGCAAAFARLLAEIGFSPSRDRLHVLGDLVNRGPDSLGVLERLQTLGDAASCLLGNHDLHLLAVATGVRRAHPSDTLDTLLADAGCERWIEWIRTRPLAATAEGWLLVHAGVVPQWDAAQTLALAAELEALLAGPDLRALLAVMYGNDPRQWRDDLAAADRWRFVINTLTRIRFCDPQGRLDFETKDGAAAAPPGFMPWFEVPGRRTAATPIAFGHWSTLGLRNTANLLALDTGCVWGGALTAARIDGGRREIFQVACPQAQAPG